MIAAVILIAVTVAIAVAAGGYFFGLFSTQTSRAAVNVRSTSLYINSSSSLLILDLEFQNAGGLSDSIASVSMPGATSAVLCTTAGDCGTGVPIYVDGTIGANTGSVNKGYVITGASFTAGQTVSFSVRLASGITIPVAVSVSAGA